MPGGWDASIPPRRPPLSRSASFESFPTAAVAEGRLHLLVASFAQSTGVSLLAGVAQPDPGTVSAALSSPLSLRDLCRGGSTRLSAPSRGEGPAAIAVLSDTGKRCQRCTVVPHSRRPSAKGTKMSDRTPAARAAGARVKHSGMSCAWASTSMAAERMAKARWPSEGPTGGGARGRQSICGGAHTDMEGASTGNALGRPAPVEAGAGLLSGAQKMA
mmetsp:Transcript_1160/g.3225  ORF Transcript_1160/g.3225 Transcript_1160/m.3225 type:complete len:216 (+) Transcript_1160:450-1097(+)